MAEKRYALIPAYQPDEKLYRITEELFENGFEIVVVDDGSGVCYEEIFRKIAPIAKILTHERNQGKGAALKTGIAYIAKKEQSPYVIVTLDADGQHSITDAIAVCKEAEQRRNSLILGSRAFDGKVPWKSKAGNTITKWIFSFVAGVKISDTQTGLRAFSDVQAEKMEEIPGERYEYEIDVLLEYAKEGREIEEVPIRTIYLDDNKSSHFHAFRDSALIYSEILKHMDIRMERRGAGW